ncbi:hypothetical protein Cgig2_016202 [Carnegiea gigantea]|uniref:Uncharacterized protein n=1 Tax=Carnegiea gigantea TaxID=171969 RepID=A0A9Q1QLN5_9CARY|nr:hypothetical protein Cgig2_016202 [Carnegiea gigantea]
MTLQCYYGLEAKIVEHHDNHRRTYACCPKRDEVAYAYFHEVDRPYPQKAMEVIDDLVVENQELWDALIDEQNTHYWMYEEDMIADAAVMDTVGRLQNIVAVAAGVIVVLTAIVASVGRTVGYVANVGHPLRGTTCGDFVNVYSTGTAMFDSNGIGSGEWDVMPTLLCTCVHGLCPHHML